MKRKINRALLFIQPVVTSRKRVDVNPLPPLGLAYIAAVLEKAGVEVKIFDCLAEGWNKRADAGNGLVRIGSSLEEIESLIRDYAPDMVGVNNLFTTQRKNAHEIYRLAKKVNKEIVTVAGGAHPTVLPEMVLSDENVDFVVLGEGEDAIINIVNFIEGKGDETAMDGVGYRADGKATVIPKTKFIKDLDRVPFPAYHLLNLELYFGLEASHGLRKKNRFMPIVTSRGCTARCSFCSAHKVWGRRFRSRSPENVVAELEYIKKTYGVEEIMFEDDNVTLDPGRAQKMFDLMIEKKLGFVWDTPNGIAAWTLTEGLIDKMKASGCYKLNFPVETGNQHVMNNIIKKPLRVEKVRPLINYAKKIGLDVSIFLVIGMPGETESQMWDSFRFARHLGVYSPHISIATPYPGSEIYDLCVQKKYFSKTFSLDDLFIRSFCISTEDWDGDKLKDIYARGEAYLLLSFLMDHPIRFAKKVLRMIIKDPVRLMRLAYKFITDKKEWGALK